MTVTLSEASSTSLSVSYATVDGTAASSVDYSAQTGTVTFAPGQTSRRVLLATCDDVLVESNETFSVQLSNATGGATIGDETGVVTIGDDDSQRFVTISEATAIEGDHTPHYRGAFVEGYPGAHFGTLSFGPDGNLYTMVGAGPGYNTIRRYSGTTGEFIDTFIAQGRVNGPRDMLFRDGYLYVGSEYTDEVLRYDASTGSFVDVFVTAGSGGINAPHGLNFGPDANGDNVSELYVSGRDSFSVVRYDGVTGQPLGTYITSGSGGLSWPEAMTFDSTGTYLYVASTGSNQILKYNAQTGAYVGVGASTGLSAPKDVKFGADGLMYVTSGGNDRLVRFTAGGAYVDDYVPPGSGGMDNPSRLAFGADGNIYVTAVGKSEILRMGRENEAIFTVTLSTPSALPVTVDFTTNDGSATANDDYAHFAGTLSFDPGIVSKTIRVPVLDLDTVVEPSEAFAVNLSSATGAVIADTQGIGTIHDDDQPAKFYVVNDATPEIPGINATYEYTSTGSASESYGSSQGDLEPRGVATTATGTMTWVVDKNKTVYVYDSCGILLGSWAANGITQPEGITVWNSDVWIVDAGSDKVFKYSGAATRLTGSQNAASSFKVNSGNKSRHGHRDRRHITVDRGQQHVGQSVQVHSRWKVGRQLDDQLRWRESDGYYTRSVKRQSGYLDRRQRLGQGVPVHQRPQSHLGQPSGGGHLRAGRGQHQPARHRRSARSGQPAGDRDPRYHRARLRRSSSAW